MSGRFIFTLFSIVVCIGVTTYYVVYESPKDNRAYMPSHRTIEFKKDGISHEPFIDAVLRFENTDYLDSGVVQQCDLNKPATTPNTAFEMILPIKSEMVTIFSAFSAVSKLRDGNKNNLATPKSIDFVASRKSNLVWKKCSERVHLPDSEFAQFPRQCSPLINSDTHGVRSSFQFTLEELKDHINYLSKVDPRKWRLPTLDEALSIIEKQCENPAVNLSIFPDTFNGEYWAASKGEYYAVDFRDGSYRKASNEDSLFVRFVISERYRRSFKYMFANQQAIAKMKKLGL